MNSEFPNPNNTQKKQQPKNIDGIATPLKQKLSRPEVEIDLEKEPQESILKPVEELIPGIDTSKQNIDINRLENSGHNFETQYSDELFNYLIKYITRLRMIWVNLIKERELLKGQVVVDLGAGMSGRHAYFLSSLAGAKSYVGVEKNHFSHLKNSLDDKPENLRKSLGNIVGEPQNYKEMMMEEFKAIPASAVDEDILTFLKRLPDNSVSIIASGIDGYVLPIGEYREKVKREIERVLNPNGALLAFYSAGLVDTQNLQDIVPEVNYGKGNHEIQLYVKKKNI